MVESSEKKAMTVSRLLFSFCRLSFHSCSKTICEEIASKNSWPVLSAPGLTALLLLYLIAAWAIVTGVLEIATAIRLLREISGEWALIVGGAFSVLFGVILAVVGSAVGLISVTWLIGVYAVAFGIILLIAAFLVWKQREVETAG
jgi:Short repeat of unknown function (DUF308)